jgi:hypothetical protein
MVAGKLAEGGEYHPVCIGSKAIELYMIASLTGDTDGGVYVTVYAITITVFHYIVRYIKGAEF